MSTRFFLPLIWYACALPKSTYYALNTFCTTSLEHFLRSRLNRRVAVAEPESTFSSKIVTSGSLSSPYRWYLIAPYILYWGVQYNATDCDSSSHCTYYFIYSVELLFNCTDSRFFRFRISFIAEIQIQIEYL
jgi:hypothetical protein